MRHERKLMGFLESERALWLLILLALIGRVAMFFYIGSGELHNSDDVAYVQSGIVFAQTGVISVWSSLPTAKIMPGMPVVTGLLSMVFGEGEAYINSIRIIWIILGCITPYVMYKCCRFHMSAPFALFAAAAFLLPNWAWTDNSVLTETPYLLFYMICLYTVFKMGDDEGESSAGTVAIFVLSFMAALMFRANILLFLPFAMAYLLLVKRKKLATLLRPALALALAMLVFVIPWSIRNYRIFDEFIPITSGTSNPTLLGTYQGESAPSDDSLDYETNVEQVMRDQYPEYFNEDGSLIDYADGEKVADIRERLKIKYRLSQWFERDPLGLIWSYLASKPASMLNWVWIWLPLPGLYYFLRFLSQINLVMCAGTALISFVSRRSLGTVLWLGGTYVINIYVISMSFASERYAAMFMPLRYMLAALGLYLATEIIKEKRAKT